MIERPSSANAVIVTGASSAIGRFLLPKLTEAGYEVFAISREVRDSGRVRWLQADLKNGEWPRLEAAQATLVHLAPVWLLPGFLENALSTGLERVIAISSTSIVTKTDSATPGEREITQLLTEGENCLRSCCGGKKVPWVLFRPTLIYGSGQDKNISSIARIIKSWRIFVIPGRGAGLRQPVHADDIAAACLSGLTGRGDDRVFNITGGSTLTYADMVEKIFLALGMKPRIVHLPLWPIKTLTPLIRLIPRFRHLTLGMLDRIDVDLCFDNADAVSRLGYAPRAFLENGRNDLGDV